MFADVENEKIYFWERVEVQLFGMPNVCEECPNLKNSYVHGLVTIHWLVSRFCVFVWPDSLSYLFYRRIPGTSGESDVSAGLHVGIVQSFIREHHLSAALHHLRSDRGSTTVPNTAKRNSYLIILGQRISLPSIREGQHLTSTKTYEQLSLLHAAEIGIGSVSDVDPFFLVVVLFLFIPPKHGLWFSFPP